MKFLVTMEMIDEKVPKDPQHLVHHVTQVIKHHEATIKMENDKKILAGGAVVGKKMDADFSTILYRGNKKR